MAFPLGVIGLILGYALLYTGAANLRNGGQGPYLLEGLGLKTDIASPSTSGGGSTPGGGLSIPNIGPISGSEVGPPAGSNPSPTQGGIINL